MNGTIPGRRRPAARAGILKQNIRRATDLLRNGIPSLYWPGAAKNGVPVFKDDDALPVMMSDTVSPEARAQGRAKLRLAGRILAPLLAILPEKWRRRTPVVAVLPLSGAIMASSRFGGGLSMAKLEKTIDGAFDVKGVSAIALVINSPGGSPAQSHLIMRRIRALAGEKKLPVFAFVEDVAASGGYMIACAADEIIADPTSIIGSIGVVSASFGFDKLIEKIGVERRVHTAGRSKTMLDPFRPEKQEDVERLLALQRDVHDIFIGLVKERRGNKLTAPDDVLFTGEFWLAARAIELGLADEIGDIRSVMRRRFGEKVRFKLVSERRGFLSRRFGLQAGLAAGQTEQMAEGLLAAIEARAIRSRLGL